MHELAVAEAIVERAVETAAGRRVRKVTIEVGDESCVSREALAFSLDLVAEGTDAAAARFEIRRAAGDTLILKSLELEEAA